MLAGFSSCESFFCLVFEVFLQLYLCYITYAIQYVIVMHPDCLMAICTPGCYMKYCCLHLWHVTMETSNKSSPMPVFWTQFCEQLGQCNYSYIELVNAYGNSSWYTINIFQWSFSNIFDIHVPSRFILWWTITNQYFEELDYIFIIQSFNKHQ